MTSHLRSGMGQLRPMSTYHHLLRLYIYIIQSEQLQYWVHVITSYCLLHSSKLSIPFPHIPTISCFHRAHSKWYLLSQKPNTGVVMRFCSIMLWKTGVIPLMEIALKAIPKIPSNLAPRNKSPISSEASPNSCCFTSILPT